MALPWFHLASIPDAGERIQLDPGEARHARGARRRGPGEELVLFDGRGGLARATIEHTGGRTLEARIVERTEVARPAPRIELVSALPKGDRQSTLLGMTTQLGLSSFHPLRSRRSVVSAGPKSAERWRRICREACKQSRQAHVPEIGDALDVDTLAERCAAGCGDAISYLLHPLSPDQPGEGEAASEPAPGLLERASRDHGHHPSTLRLIVGPEGGFEDDEVVRLRAAGATAVALVGGILRIEAAAALGVGLLAQAFRTAPASARWA